ncbi:hypothetical protein [Sphingomonas sp. Leaf37]|uniref:hypothetical protein n=1 Tax=Sphingomonas sp. Leaf37 TaxID=2876552 RepID=UPI001E62C6A9|nr:hypothetical protein [Sphingomonas sp. Leaf37]
MRDLSNIVHPVVAIAPAAPITDNTVLTSNIIDKAGYESLVFLILLGTLAAAAATFAVTVEHGDAADLSDAAAVPAANLTGTLAQASFDQAADNKSRKIGYTGAKRYVRLKITPAGNNAAAPISALALLGDGRFIPTPNPPG